jgi:hypothetical protein
MNHALRRIDHVVVAVHDLDAAGAFYGRLGFQVGPRNRHPWGTENRLIQFGSSFIELITVGPDADAIPHHEEGRFSFGGFVRDYLRAREGLAMLALDSDDARADAARFSREGIGSFEPFSFERRGRRPDGSETHVAFTLAFAVASRAPEAAFFVCQQHFPENFWNSSFQRHENGASGIATVGLTAESPGEHEAFLAAFSGSPAQREPDGSLSIELLDGRLNVVPDTTAGGELQLRSVTIRIPDPAAQARRLAEAGIPFTDEHGDLSIPAESAFGLVIRFTRSG